MRKRYRAGLVGLACLLLAGCAGRVAPTPADSVALLRTGQAPLNCREPCLAEWRQVQPQAAQLAAGARWRDLAVLVLRVGYRDDLSLYYLGRAAEGLFYPGAAAGYYRQSMQLSATSSSCQYLSRQCGGVVLPRAALLRVAAIDRELSPPRLRRTVPAPQRPEAPGAAPPSAEAPAVSQGGQPAPIPVEPAASDYIEPPPAAR